MKITDEDIKKICSPTIYKRGVQYYKEGRVHLRVRKNDFLLAAIDDDRLYNVHISFDENSNITDTLCTCPYYHTMGSACKHIVAALKTRQAELSEGEGFDSENDRLASILCSEFGDPEKNLLRLKVILKITVMEEKISYSAAFSIIDNEDVYAINGIEKFLSCYLGGKEYKLSKTLSISRKNCEFDPASKAILDILSESYENKAFTSDIYSPRLYETEFGSKTALRLMPLLKNVECEYVIDSISYKNPIILKDDPDILVDVLASGKNINISITESATALTPGGEWVLFENKIYKTSREWQKWFMPLYRTIISQNRTQLEFSKDNCIEFVAKVLPVLKKNSNVVCYGVDELVINENPKFEVFFDRVGRKISAVVKALYGNVSIILPCTHFSSDKVVIRDNQAEKHILSFFSEFDFSDNTLSIEDDEEIFAFMTSTLPELKKYAKIYTSDSFKSMIEDTLPNVSAQVSYDRKIDLLELTIESNLTEEELQNILKAYFQRKSFYRFSSGSFYNFDAADESLELLINLYNENENIKGSRKLPMFYSLYFASRAKNGEIKADSSFMKMMDKALSSTAKIPDYLDRVLRDYQKVGVNWMHQLSKLGLGGILADDMGLGKTLQVIAFVMSTPHTTPSLVITPSSLLYNWLDEIQRFSPDAKVKVIDGPREERERALRDIDGYDFILTSYVLLRRDIQIYKRYNFSYCFIDEAQYIKNPKTMNALAVKKINANGRFALTGTPIENSLSELWSIFDFVLSGYLSSYKDFSSRYEKPVAKDKAHYALTDLRGKIKPFILRRMKKEVLSQLPPKIENTILADFEAEQKEIYSAFLKMARNEISAYSPSESNTMKILSLLTRLRQLSCHPALINPEYKKESGKLKLLGDLIKSGISSNHRILVFSQFTSMLSLIDKALKNEGIDSFYLDGSTPGQERLNLVNRFNSGEKDVFLISLKAGGTGLNLTGADMVIHYDPWWNPAVMDQASDRAHRIGQKNTVQVIKLATRGSIEEQILKLAEKKRHLADSIIHENSNLLSSFTKEELLELFN